MAIIPNPIAVEAKTQSNSQIPLLSGSFSERVKMSGEFRQFGPFAQCNQAGGAKGMRSFNVDGGAAGIGQAQKVA